MFVLVPKKPVEWLAYLSAQVVRLTWLFHQHTESSLAVAVGQASQVQSIKRSTHKKFAHHLLTAHRHSVQIRTNFNTLNILNQLTGGQGEKHTANTSKNSGLFLCYLNERTLVIAGEGHC